MIPDAGRYASPMKGYSRIRMTLSLSNSLVSENGVNLMKSSILCGRGILVLEGIKELPAKHIENIMQAGVLWEMLAMHAIVFSSQAR